MAQPLPAIRRLFDAVGPNPWVVRLALALKGVDYAPFTRKLRLDEQGRPENRFEPELVALNPARTTPFVQLEDGSVLTESVAMVRYIDALYAGRGPALAGDPACALSRARVDMWAQRMSLNLLAPYQRQFQYGEGLPYFKQHVPWAEASAPSVPGLRAQVEAQLRLWEEHEMGGAGGGDGEGEGDEYLAGGADVSVVDLQLWTTAVFMGKVNSAKLTGHFDPFGAGGLVGAELPRLQAWYERMGARVGALGKAGK
jgi:glutathione S-transferase